MAATNFWYYNNLPFNVVNNPYWEGLVNALTIAGKGFKAPTKRELGGPLLEEAVKTTQLVVDDKKKVWQRKGCSILLDRWTDGWNRTLLNFLVASNGTLVFLKSIDALYEVKNAKTLCNILDGVVQEVGVENVVQLRQCSSICSHRETYYAEASYYFMDSLCCTLLVFFVRGHWEDWMGKKCG